VAHSEQPSRPSAGIGAVIRRNRASRFTLAELAQRSGVSSGLLSLIERGRGNPSIETLRRIATALDLAVVDLLAAAEGVTAPVDDGARSRAVVPMDDRAADVLDRPTGAAESTHQPAGGWRTSMILGRGQEARVRVLHGSLELLLRDAHVPLEGVAERPPLAVDLELRTPGDADAPVLGLPPADDPRWLRLATGSIPFQPTTVAARMLFTHVTRCIRHDSSSPNVDRWVSELRGYFVKYEAVSQPELKRIFG
jgi:transcriptional regulator with XRE-family HTH domain